MKKFISVVLSVIMAVSVMAVAVVPAMAAVSPQSTTHSRVLGANVNGSTTNDVSYATDATDPNKITFTYNGDGTVTGWEFPGLVLGVDYEIITEADGSITVSVLNAGADIVANAIVDFGDEDEEETTKPKKQDKGETSPKTGAMTAAGIAVAGAGFAILSALKKNEDAE